jgi:hypothetical protein
MFGVEGGTADSNGINHAGKPYEIKAEDGKISQQT